VSLSSLSTSSRLVDVAICISTDISQYPTTVGTPVALKATQHTRTQHTRNGWHTATSP
jgi:hypothetical protein